MNDSLWNFAARCYRAPGVAESCLALQDRAGADVNLVLTAAWLAQRSCEWRATDVSAAISLCADWRTYCVLPLRSIRRYLKEAADEGMYQRAKALELEAEMIQLRKIEAALEHLMPLPTVLVDVSLKKNLTLYIEVAELGGADLTDAIAAITKALTTTQ